MSLKPAAHLPDLDISSSVATGPHRIRQFRSARQRRGCAERGEPLRDDDAACTLHAEEVEEQLQLGVRLGPIGPVAAAELLRLGTWRAEGLQWRRSWWVDGSIVAEPGRPCLNGGHIVADEQHLASCRKQRQRQIIERVQLAGADAVRPIEPTTLGDDLVTTAQVHGDVRPARW